MISLTHLTTQTHRRSLHGICFPSVWFNRRRLVHLSVRATDHDNQPIYGLNFPFPDQAVETGLPDYLSGWLVPKARLNAIRIVNSMVRHVTPLSFKDYFSIASPGFSGTKISSIDKSNARAIFMAVSRFTPPFSFAILEMCVESRPVFMVRSVYDISRSSKIFFRLFFILKTPP